MRRPMEEDTPRPELSAEDLAALLELLSRALLK